MRSKRLGQGVSVDAVWPDPPVPPLRWQPDSPNDAPLAVRTTITTTLRMSLLA